ncbi:MAG: fused MFS/spermidine synthase [Steroidobacteraceae bacterium]
MSGFAALVYQTAWTRQFALVFGTSELAVATVLAAYMGGLALGAWLIERWLSRVERPVLVYAGLELGIGGSAVLLVPALLFASDALLQAAFGGQPAPPDSGQVGTSLFYLGSAFVALAVPTTLMGATLPLLARYAVRSDEQIGRRIGALYAANTAGAVGGALATAFWLLPNLGLSRTVWAGAAVNFAVFLLAALVAKRSRPTTAEARSSVNPAPTRTPFRRPPAAVWVLPLMLASGAVSFFHEVLWTRMLGHVLGSSIYAFGVMVASFLVGIAAGGAAGALLARDRRRAVTALAIAQLISAAAAAGAYLGLQELVPEKAGLVSNAFFAAGLLLPLTLAIGLTYPLAVRVLADDAANAAPASARVYAWNTVGAIIGSLVAGFIAIPALRFEGAAQAAVIASALLAVAAVLLLMRPARLLGGAVTAAALIGIVSFQPERPERLLVTSPLNVGTHGRIVYYEVGRSASVVVLEQDGGLALRTNGLPEALMEMPGSSPRFSGEFWLSPLAVIARPRTERMLIVGYGGGVIVEGVPPSVARIDVIELEPEVIEANRATRSLRKRDPLIDPRVDIVTNDARGALALTSRRYDAIVSQPSHPWTAGASHLYTREFMRQAREHLNDDGVFVQWMNVSFVDESLLRSLTATLLNVFGHVRLYRPDPNTLVFLASPAPLDLERTVAGTGVPLTLSPGHYARFGINVVEDLVGALAADADGARALASGAPLVTDDDNRLATSSVFELGRGLTAEAAGRLLAAYDPLQRADSGVYRELGDRLAFDYIARRVATFTSIDASIPDRLLRVARLLEGTAHGAYVHATALRSAGRREAAARHVRESLARFPGSSALRHEYLQPWFPALTGGRAPAEVAAEAAKLTGNAATVLQAGRLGATNRWHELPEIDRALAAVEWTDPWKLEAVQMRADWRVRVSNEDVRRRFGEEALALVDQAIVVEPTVALYAMRARCALAADRPDVLVESVWGFAQGAFANIARLEPNQRAEARANVEGLMRVLDENAADRRVNPERVKEVRSRLEDVARQLAAPA